MKYKMGNKNRCSGQPSSDYTENFLNVGKSLQIYANKNNLMNYEEETRRYIEKAFIFQQAHISDKLIQLTRNDQRIEKISLLKDLLKINFQQFDQMCHKSDELKKKIQNRENIQQNEIKITKIDSKFIKQGEKCLRLHNFLFIITINCFGQSHEDDPFQPTGLPSNKSKISIFKQKIQALRLRYNCKLQVCVICPSFLFEKIHQQFYNDGTFMVLQFNLILPFLTLNNKIILQGNKIKFNQTQGDLINLLFRHAKLKQYEQKFDYIVFADIQNILSPAINPAFLGLLNSQKNTKILASIKLPQSTEKIRIQNQFIVDKNMAFGDIIVKTQFLKAICSTDNIPSLINKRIKKKKVQMVNDCYFFSRLPQDILNIAFTAVVKVPYSANNMIELSNFYKQLLGIENENENDIIEISPIVLHGIPEQLEQIRQKLRQRSDYVNYPIIITKNKDIEEQ